MPNERARAVLLAEEFLMRLANDKSYRSLKDIRHTAKSILRHYPSQYDISKLCDESDRWQWPADFERDGVRVAPIHLLAERPGFSGIDSSTLGEEVGTLVSATSKGIEK